MTLKFSRPRNRATGSGDLGYDIERLDDHAGVDIPVQVPHTDGEPWPSNVDEWGDRVSTTGGRTYVFRVRAKDADGTGAWSSRVRHEAPDGPGKPDPHPDPPGQPKVTQTNSWLCDAVALVHSDSWCGRQIRVEVADMQAWAHDNNRNDLAIDTEVRDRHSSEVIGEGFQSRSLSTTDVVRPGHHRVRARVRMDPSDNNSYTRWSAWASLRIRPLRPESTSQGALPSDAVGNLAATRSGNRWKVSWTKPPIRIDTDNTSNGAKWEITNYRVGNVGGVSRSRCGAGRWWTVQKVVRMNEFNRTSFSIRANLGPSVTRIAVQPVNARGRGPCAEISVTP